MKTVLLCALLVSLVAVSAAIDCYTCSGTDCGDPFDPDASGVSNTCPGGAGAADYCAKAVDNDVVVRTCASACTEGSVGETSIYCCETNLCNGGTAVKTSFVAMGVALLVVFIFSNE